MVVEGRIEITQEEPESEHASAAAEKGNDSTVTNKNKERREGKEEEVSSKRHKSDAWQHFDLLPIESQEDGELRAKCKYCGRKIKCDPAEQGTSGLKKHADRCILNPNKGKKSSQSLLASTLQGSNKTLSCHIFNQDRCRKALAQWIILDEMPFRVVEGAGFKQMMNEIEPRFHIPSRATITRDCLRLHMEESIKLKRHFKRTKVRVSLTTDTWTSCQNANYMCLTAHWIDDNWTYQKRILNFCVVENHKGDTIASTIERCLLSWNIDKVFTITVDNASSNDSALAKLKVVLRHWNGLVCNGDFLHLRCCAHILNLIVSDGLKDLHDSIEGIRNAVKYVRSSPSRMNKFKELVHKMKIDSKSLLSMDCPTRWNSIYIMLESAIKFTSVFERMLTDDSDYTTYFMDKHLVGPPSKLDFDNCKEFVVFLQVFYDITLQMSGSLHVTSNLCFQNIADVSVILNESAIDQNTLVSKMAQSMQSKYAKYWGSFETLNPLLVIAAILDPMYKMKYLKVALKEILFENAKCDAVLKNVTKVLYRLYDHYSSELGTSPPQSQIQTQAASESASTSSTSSSTSTRLQLLASKPTVRQFVIQSEVDNQLDKYGEVQKYLDGELLDWTGEDFDILTWWKQHASKFKVLSLIAHDILAMPFSTVSSESAFSTGGRVINEYRSSLSSKTVEALICAQNWISPSSLCEKLKGLHIDDFNDTHAAEQAKSAASNKEQTNKESNETL